MKNFFMGLTMTISAISYASQISVETDFDCIATTDIHPRDVIQFSMYRNFDNVLLSKEDNWVIPENENYFIINYKNKYKDPLNSILTDDKLIYSAKSKFKILNSVDLPDSKVASFNLNVLFGSVEIYSHINPESSNLKNDTFIKTLENVTCRAITTKMNINRVIW